MLNTDQEIFDTVARHLLNQGKRSAVVDSDIGGNGCRYRTDDGLMCAVGCLINDEAYAPDLEGKPSWSPEVRFALRESGINLGFNRDKTSDLLGDLQQLHDDTPPDDWRDSLILVAEDYDFEWKF